MSIAAGKAAPNTAAQTAPNDKRPKCRNRSLCAAPRRRAKGKRLVKGRPRRGRAPSRQKRMGKSSRVRSAAHLGRLPSGGSGRRCSHSRLHLALGKGLETERRPAWDEERRFRLAARKARQHVGPPRSRLHGDLLWSRRVCEAQSRPFGGKGDAKREERKGGIFFAAKNR